MLSTRLFHAIVIGGCALVSPLGCGPELNGDDPTSPTMGHPGTAAVDSGENGHHHPEPDAGETADAGATTDAGAVADAGHDADAGHVADGGWHPTK